MEETPQTPGDTPQPPGEAPQPPSGPPQPPAGQPAPAGAGPEGPVHTPLTSDMGTSTDAMGLDKYRQVIGKTYGPTKRQQVRVFAIFFACVAVALVGGKLLADQLDKPPESNPAVAPWAAPDAPQRAVTIPTEPKEANQP